MESETIICTKCKKEKSLEEFYNKKRGSYKKRTVCKECHREFGKKYNKKWRDDNPEYKKNRRQKLRSGEIPYKKINEKKCPGCKIVKPVDKWGKNTGNVDGLQDACVECQNKRNNKRVKERRKIDPLFKLRLDITNALKYGLRNISALKNNRSTLKLINTTIEQFENHFIKLINKPCPVCNRQWDNTFEMDHIVPQCLARKGEEQDVFNLNQLYNLRMTCRKCNRDKASKIPTVYDSRLNYLVKTTLQHNKKELQ